MSLNLKNNNIISNENRLFTINKVSNTIKKYNLEKYYNKSIENVNNKETNCIFDENSEKLKSVNQKKKFKFSKNNIYQDKILSKFDHFENKSIKIKNKNYQTNKNIIINFKLFFYKILLKVNELKYKTELIELKEIKSNINNFKKNRTIDVVKNSSLKEFYNLIKNENSSDSKNLNFKKISFFNVNDDNNSLEISEYSKNEKKWKINNKEYLDYFREKFNNNEELNDYDLYTLLDIYIDEEDILNYLLNLLRNKPKKNIENEFDEKTKLIKFYETINLNNIYVNNNIINLNQKQLNDNQFLNLKNNLKQEIQNYKNLTILYKKMFNTK